MNKIILSSGQINTGIPQIDSGLNAIIKVLIAGIIAYGIVLLVKSVPNIVDGVQSHDNQSLKQGVFGVVAGLLLISISALLALFGVSTPA